GRTRPTRWSGGEGPRRAARWCSIRAGVRRGARRLHQDASDLGPRELGRRQLAGGEHGADLGAAEEDVLVLAVRAGLGRGHVAARAAEEGVLELERRDAQLLGLEAVEHALGVVGAVVVADARVVAPDDEVGAAVVLAAERVEDGLARAGVAHGGGEDGE